MRSNSDCRKSRKNSKGNSKRPLKQNMQEDKKKKLERLRRN